MSKLSRKDAAKYLAPIVFPNEYDEQAAINLVQAAFSYHIKIKNLPTLDPSTLDKDVLLNWVAWMAGRPISKNPWRLVLGQIPDLPINPTPPRAKPVVGNITTTITINVVPSTLEESNQAFIDACKRIKELEQFERRYRKDVKNGKEGGRGNEK